MSEEVISSDANENEAALSGASSTQILSPFCGALRSKKFFMMDQLATDASHYLDSSNHCWCGETQMVIGPDGGRVHPERCKPGRSCFSSALGS